MLVVGRDLRFLLGLAALTLLVALGAARLSSHEAIGAQSAREMIASGDWLVPTISGQPWLEKPPLATWLIAASGLVFGRVSEFSSRLPSALAALALVLGVFSIASRRLGRRVGLLAGLVQITTPWLILRGRLAEVDVILAALVVWSFAALDRVRMGSVGARSSFFVLVGLMSLAKGIGFGAALVVATTLMLILWDRDWSTFRALLSPVGIGVSVLIALVWPLLVLAKYPEALSLWTMHVTDRFAARPSYFAGETWTEYLLTPLVQTLPWGPLAVIGVLRFADRRGDSRSLVPPVVPDQCLGGSVRGHWSVTTSGTCIKPTPASGCHSLPTVWLLVPAVLVSLSSTRNSHYLIYALPPLSIWAAQTIDRLAERKPLRVSLLFAVLALSWSIVFLVIGPRINSRDAEFAFYERVGRLIPKSQPLLLLYSLEGPGRWDREPYFTPFGPVPSDLAPRLYYLSRPAPWRSGTEDLLARCPQSSFAVIGRERDLPTLERIGRVEILDRGPTSRWDRSYVLFRVARRVATVPFIAAPPVSRVSPGVAGKACSG